MRPLMDVPRQREEEAGTATRLGLGPRPPTLTLDCAAHDAEAYAMTGKVVAVQTRERLKQLACRVTTKADAVVAHLNDNFVCHRIHPALHIDTALRAIAAKFHRIANQVSQRWAQQVDICMHRG